MDCDGDVVVGNYSGNPSYDFEVRGQAYISCLPATSGIYFTNYSTIAAIKPQWNNSARCGLYDNKFYYMYTNWLYYDNLYDWSDLGIKENIRNIDSPLSALCQLRGVKYDIKREHYANSPEENMEEIVESGKNKYGVIAQELKEVLPDLVTFNDEAELYAVNYVGLIPILIEAIKEQQEMIQTLQGEVQTLKNESNLKSLHIATNNDEYDYIAGSALKQNSPNPFDESTEIFFYISENTQSAAINIYNMSGTQLKSIELNQRGEGNILINGSELDPGMYMYAMIANGKVVDIKQMILTD
ncbi:MAG: tail fiber domain-containing protein [Bacteroidota bacterium]